ncbi:MAG: cytochrome b family protein [Planctomycetota bacterium]|jgi:hypothetical protein
MSLVHDLKLERYKLVTDRQKYFTELARSAFATYLKVFTGLAGATIALISAKSKLDITQQLLRSLVDSVALLVSFLGVVSIGQIIFCLVRWHGFRRAEIKVNSDSPPLKSWFWVFEGLYCLAIAISVGAVWLVSRQLLAAIGCE